MLRLAIVFLFLLVSTSHAQIILDGSMGVAGALIGPNFSIPSSAGQTRGSNLFHSFGLFNVLTGQSATFTGPNSISNIFGRVTGGQASTIDGTIRSTIPNANLFLMNPAGMMFGPNARLNVQGSFYATTADYLKFADGAKFHAELNRQSTLTSAPVSAFGFLSQNPAGISVQKSVLQLPAGKTFSIVGGDIDIAGGPLGFIAVPAGIINIAAVGSPGEVPVNVQDLSLPSFDRLGQINITNAGLLDASGNGGGTVVIRGGRLLVDRSFVFADNLGHIDGASVGMDIVMAADATIRNGSSITTDSFAAGRARDFQISADAIEVNDSVLRSNSFATGNGGDLTINVRTLTVANAAQISADTLGSGNSGKLAVGAQNINLSGASVIADSTFGRGNGGTLYIVASETLSLAGTSNIITSAQPNSAGNAGDMTIEAKNLKVTGGAQIFGGTFGSGNGGIVRVIADTISLDGTGSSTRAGLAISSGIASGTQPGSTGNAGDIIIQTRSLTVTNGAQISSPTYSTGNAGTVRVSAADAISLDGIFTVDGLAYASAISSAAQPGSTGNAGNVVVEANNVTLTGGATIGGDTLGLGHGATVRVTANNTLSLDGSNSSISTTSFPTSNGNAGDILIEAKNVTVANRAIISSATLGPGNGGTVRVIAGETISIDGTGAIISNGVVGGSGIFAGNYPGSTGDAGNIIVEARDILLTGGAQIANATTGPGRGGTVRVTAAQTISFDGGLITSDGFVFAGGITASSGPESTGAAGDITVEARNATVSGGAQIASTAFGSGKGGTVRVTAADTIRVDGTIASAGFVSASGINASSQSGSTANAGDIVIEAKNVMVTGGAEISSATFGSGKGGTALVTARNAVSLSGTGSDGVGSRISSSSSGDGIGGSIEVRARQVNLNDRATLTTTSSGTGNAGDINVHADELRMVNSSVTTEADFSDGGNIHLTVGKLLELVNSQITATVKSGFGSGGNVTVDPQFAILNHSQIAANAFGGPGGKVTIVADNFLASPDSSITASSALSAPGTVDIQAPIIDLTGSLAPLPEAIAQASSLLRQSCAARFSSGKLSSLATSGTGGMPFEPGRLLPSSVALSADTIISRDNGEKAQTLLAAAEKFSIASPCGLY